MTTTKSAPATPEALKTRQEALARVRAEHATLGPTLPELERNVAEAQDLLRQAKLARFVASGTPGFEDDVAAERSAKVALEKLDQACLARDRAEELLEDLVSAEKQLHREVGEIQGALHLQHMEASKAALRERIAKGALVFAEVVRNIAALRLLEHVTTWPEELNRAVKESTPVGELQPLVKEGQARGDRIMAGATVQEVCP